LRLGFESLEIECPKADDIKNSFPSFPLSRARATGVSVDIILKISVIE